MKKIEVKNLKKQFNKIEAVKGIDFQIDQNETLALLGPNGCGKTTTIGMLLGLITPTSGNIFINEQELNYKNHQFLSIMNFASPYVELPKKLTVLENLKVYGRMYLIKNLKDKIDQLVEDLNLKSFLNKRTGELSSGQKNRVSLAKSLINDPKILLLDEPTASLDPDTGDYVRSYLEKYKQENDISILLASHNMDEVTRLSDDVLMMKDGQIIDHGKAKELIDKHGRDTLEQVFLKLVREKNEH
ncbi:ABC transporter ATP-binding protein [Pelagibacteraceae bacterium]|nr:ABC transporter ATP-binding protein [Pelagibacteraceae bacterium]